MSTMRAMRRLKPDPVPDELLTKLVQAATWAPSGSNLQGYEFVVVTDRALMGRLAGLWSRSVEAYLNSVGRVTPAAQDEGIRRALLFQRDHFHETPALIVPCYHASRVDSGTARRLLTSFPPGDAARLAARGQRFNALGEASSVYPGVQNILLAARAMGLGAVITIWHLMLEHEWKKELGIPKRVNTFAVIPVGWPRGRFGPVTRRPAAEVIHRDRW
ncbi:MAG: nitroreductase family protein [Solirubrobacteraceae bacterium]